MREVWNAGETESAIVSPGKSVFVFGFPHSGTTILRTVIGRCRGITEVREESIRPPDDDRRYVFKWPAASEDFCCSGRYDRVFILRNPLCVFSSIFRRFPARELPPGHSIEDWERAAELFLRKRGSSVMTILYEDLFPSSHSALRTLVGALGLDFHEHILHGCEPTGPAPSPVREHSPYRYWQVSQPFRCMNSAVDLPENVAEKIAGLPAFRELWGKSEALSEQPATSPLNPS